MAIREVPKSFEYTCDNCGKTHLQQNASGHYTNSVPPRWHHLWWIKGEDSDGRSYDIKKLLCDACGPLVLKSLAGMNIITREQSY